MISILTPSIPERAAMLEECKRSVVAQTSEDWEHLIEIDTERRGCAVTMNLLAERAVGEWLLPLADDDLLLPGCLEQLLAYSEDAEIVYPPPLVWGQPAEWFTQAPPVIPSFALIRRSLWVELGGYDESRVREEDRDFWIKALAAGARFVRADAQPTWVYRHHGGNKSFNHGIAA
jgi:GT2 family glycosyltransferase